MDRFRIISRLGAGGFGEAFRAWDSDHGVPVVLKRPLKKHLQRPDVLARFDREINRLLELTHPHIVPIIAHGRDSNGLPYLAMRFLPAGSLADRKKPHPFSFLHRWLPSVAAALDHVHAHGIVHRDVKPANIFFDTESQAYLGDFGIAKVIDEDLAQESEHSLTSTGGEIGTYPYMGPEFFHKPRVLSGAYDQYALAVSVYEMICGRRPFSGDSGQLVVAHVTQAPPDVRRFSPDAPASLCGAIMRALSKKPADRFGTCADFAKAALRDVMLISRDESVKRFLCPGCHRLVKVPTELSGRSCRCPDCSVRLRVSEKLDALWLRQEDPSSVDVQSPSVKASLPGGPPSLAAEHYAALQQWLEPPVDASDDHETTDEEPLPARETNFHPQSAPGNQQEPAPRRPTTDAAHRPTLPQEQHDNTEMVSVAPHSLKTTLLSFASHCKNLSSVKLLASGLSLCCIWYAVSGGLPLHRPASRNPTPPLSEQANQSDSVGGDGSLTPAGAIELIGAHEGPLFLPNETSLKDETAAVLAAYRDDLHLPRVTEITLRATKALASHDGWLGLNGLEHLTAEQLKILATHNGPVSLLGLASLPRDATEVLASTDNLLIPLRLTPPAAATSETPE